MWQQVLFRRALFWYGLKRVKYDHKNCVISIDPFISKWVEVATSSMHETFDVFCVDAGESMCHRTGNANGQ